MLIKPIRTICWSKKAKRTYRAKLLAAMTLVCLVAMIPTLAARAANLPLVVNPATGLDAVALDQRFFWTSSPPTFISSIGTPGGRGLGAFLPIYELTVATDSTVDAMALDGFGPGDVFELWADGSSVPWDNSFIDSSGFFHGDANDYFLTTGTHEFTIRVTRRASSGGAWLSFSPVTAIPEPSTLSLAALGLLAIVRRRRNRV